LEKVKVNEKKKELGNVPLLENLYAGRPGSAKKESRGSHRAKNFSAFFAGIM